MPNTVHFRKQGATRSIANQYTSVAMNYVGNNRSRLRGQAAVEFALITVVLLAMLYGIMEISRLVMIRSEVSNAAREGVQYASLHPNRSAACIQQKAIDPKLSMLQPGDIVVSRPQVQIAPFLPITVTVKTTWQSLVNFVPDPATLSFKPLGPIIMQSSSMKLIENASADTSCP